MSLPYIRNLRTLHKTLCSLYSLYRSFVSLTMFDDIILHEENLYKTRRLIHANEISKCDAQILIPNVKRNIDKHTNLLKNTIQNSDKLMEGYYTGTACLLSCWGTLIGVLNLDGGVPLALFGGDLLFIKQVIYHIRILMMPMINHLELLH